MVPEEIRSSTDFSLYGVTSNCYTNTDCEVCATSCRTAAQAVNTVTSGDTADLGIKAGQ